MDFAYRLPLASFLRECLFPAGCAVCGAGLTGITEAWYGLCEDCLGWIAGELAEASAVDRCDCCGRPLVSEQGRCLPCRNGEERSFDRIVAVFPYTGPYRRLLAAYKFDKNLALAKLFAERIEAALAGSLAIPVPQDAVIVPVPPRPGKIRQAGWDQVEYLARLLGRGKKVSRCLKRLPSQIQKKLGREDRKTNLQGRLRLVKEPPKNAILIDDVMTTGSTLDACAAVLKSGGAETVYGVCLFYD